MRAKHLTINLIQTCLLAATVLALPTVAQAQFTYTTKNSTVTITGYTGPGGAVTIPANINGYPVTGIGNYAFDACHSLTSVTIGNNVTSIGDWAFEYCTNLTRVTIPNSVTSIGGWVFENCYSLTNVMVGNSVTSIEYEAFKGCYSLTSSTIGTSVTSIRYEAFAGTALTSVTIPNSVTDIGWYPFVGCYSLTVIAVDTNNAVYSSVNRVLFDKSQTTLILCPEGISGSYTILDSVTSIADSVFELCSSLTSVTIGNGVTNIGSFAFVQCYSLTSVTIGNGVTSIGDWAFLSCNSLTVITVNMDNPVYSSVNGVLFDKSQTTLIQYPGGRGASYPIPNSVTNIGFGAFGSCTSLTSVTIPSSVSSIGNWAFTDCYSLTNVYFTGNAPAAEGSVFAIDDGLVRYYSATAYYLPGTTGWADFSANTGIPAVPWLPLIQTGDASFGVRTNQFGFNINWASGQTVVAEACTNLANPIWSPIATNTLTSDSFYFSDPQWTNYAARFFRLRSP